jgi:putative peptide zinc metalloprotease protein
MYREAGTNASVNRASHRGGRRFAPTRAASASRLSATKVSRPASGYAFWMVPTQSRVLRRLLVALVATIAVTLAPLPAAAQEGGANNVVVATGTADGSFLSRSGVQVAPVGSDVVTSTNLALANSFACTGCRTVAVAFQAVLIARNASTIAPTNAAVVTNDGCNSCATFAYAYQYVLTTEGPVHLTLAGQSGVFAVRMEAAALAASDLDFDELSARLDVLAARFKAIVDNELVGPGSIAGTDTRRVATETAP